MPLLPIGLMASSGGPPLLLDKLAFSTRGGWSVARRLRAAYAGYAIRVRRSSDNAEQDFGFTGPGNLDTSSLLSFCGTASGFSSKVYDHSGLGHDFVQTVAAKQPQIVNAGALITTAGGRPTLKFDAFAAPRYLVASPVAISGSAFSAYGVATNINSGPTYTRLLSYLSPGKTVDYGSSDAAALFLLYTSTLAEGYCDGAARGTATIGTALFQYSSVWTGSAHTLTVDGTTGGAFGATPSFTTGGALYLGSFGPQAQTGDYWSGLVPETILASGTASSADIATIRTDQQTYYGTP